MLAWNNNGLKSDDDDDDDDDDGEKPKVSRGVWGHGGRFRVHDVHRDLSVRGGGIRGSRTRDIVSPARGLHTHNRPRNGGRPCGHARAHGGHNYNTLVNNGW